MIHDQSFPVALASGWVFQVVFMEGHVQVEAHGFGIACERLFFLGKARKLPRIACAGRRRRRRALHSAWLRGSDLPAPRNLPSHP